MKGYRIAHQWLASVVILVLLGAGFTSTIVGHKKGDNRDGDIFVFYPTDDTEINEADGPDVPRGGNDHLKIRNKYGAGGVGIYQIDGLIRFDISSLPPDCILISASLYLYYYHWHDTNPAGRELNLYRICEDWNEETATWNNQPTYAPEPTTFSPVPGSINQWMSWNVTDDIQLFVNGQEENFGWKITDENYWGTYNIPYIYLRTKECVDFVPYLEITIEELYPPSANFIYIPENPTTADVIQFTDTSIDSDGTIVAWWWDFGDDYYSSRQHPTHCYDADGSYNVSLTVTDDDALTDTITKTLIVYTPPNTPPDTPHKPYGPSFGRIGKEYPFITKTNDADNDLIYYLWDWGDETNSSWIGPYGSGVLAAASHIWTQQGVYHIRVKVKDVYGAESSWSNPKTIRIIGLYQEPLESEEFVIPPG